MNRTAVSAPPGPAAAEVQVRGMSFRNALEGLRDLRGDEAALRVRAAVPRDVAEIMATGGFITTAWYPVAQYRAFLGAITDVMGGGPSSARELAKHNTHKDLRGIYRLLVFFLSPEDIIRKSPVLYGRYRRGGRLSIPEASANHATVLFEGCRGYDAACWQELLGGAEAALEAAGAKNVASTVLEGGQDGDTTMRARAQWTR
jgi:hypothetical protein